MTNVAKYINSKGYWKAGCVLSNLSNANRSQLKETLRGVQTGGTRISYYYAKQYFSDGISSKAIGETHRWTIIL